ncbi:unnamed protein product [Didymodactylos carnosus]|uniref:Uncharacterized protein n=1 Tax=Didymodactylos carnosus TaxID=1234261 RepID=A0A814F4T8_9BILA|nr:unnamed protein product [Didymodactylos carnosus]CAF1297280.1 unnamed protein product [Didymodactylos carnosus]CAF3749449.1 unnamed protein product [Didymodactylos carnosus]CAF4102660.1 unnamed protein product [Didymodactylos carnosus]
MLPRGLTSRMCLVQTEFPVSLLMQHDNYVFTNRDCRSCTNYPIIFITLGWVFLVLSIPSPFMCNDILRNHFIKAKETEEYFTIHMSLTCVALCLSLMFIHLSFITTIYEHLHVVVGSSYILMSFIQLFILVILCLVSFWFGWQSHKLGKAEKLEENELRNLDRDEAYGTESE